HAQIGNDAIGGKLCQCFQGQVGAVLGADGMARAFQAQSQQAQQAGIVVNEQDVTGAVHGFSFDSTRVSARSLVWAAASCSRNRASCALMSSLLCCALFSWSRTSSLSAHSCSNCCRNVFASGPQKSFRSCSAF